MTFTKLKHILKSGHFRSSFLVLFLIIFSAFFLAFFSIQSQRETSYRKSLSAQTNKISALVQNVLYSARTDAILAGSVQSVDTLLSMKSPELQDYINMLNDMRFCSNMPYYQSVDIFINSQQKVYVSQLGMYDEQDYLGKDITELVNSGAVGSNYLVNREYKRYYGENFPVPVTTYLQSLPVNASYSNGYIAINISHKLLDDLIRKNISESEVETVVTFQNGVIFSSSGKLLQQLEDSGNPTQQKIEEWAAASGYRVVASDNSSDVKSYHLYTQSNLWPNQTSHAFFLLGATVCLLVLTFGIAAGYSFIMLRPIDRFIQKISGDAKDSAENLSEYTDLQKVFENLSTEWEDVHKLAKQNSSIVLERLVLELITSFVELDAEKKKFYLAYGMQFPHPFFAVLITKLQYNQTLYTYAEYEQVKLFLRRTLTDALGEIGVVYSTYHESDTVLFLLNAANYPKLKATISAACQRVKNNPLVGIKQQLELSFGICDSEKPVPNQAYIQARKNMYLLESENLDDSFGSVYENIPVVDKRTAYTLANCIFSQDTSLLHQEFRTFTSKYVKPEMLLDDIHKIMNTVICRVYTRLVEIGFEPNDAKLSTVLLKIRQADDAEKCISTAISYFTDMIDSGKKISDESYTYVSQAISFMEQNFQSPLTVTQIAETVSLNPIYFNRIFKSATGKTIADYLNRYRIARAEELLTCTNMTLAAIAPEVGYTDTRSFVRFFKKYHEISPAKFKELAAAKQRPENE